MKSPLLILVQWKEIYLFRYLCYGGIDKALVHKGRRHISGCFLLTQLSEGNTALLLRSNSFSLPESGVSPVLLICFKYAFDSS